MKVFSLLLFWILLPVEHARVQAAELFQQLIMHKPCHESGYFLTY